MMAALIAPSLLPYFQTCEEPSGLDDVALCARFTPVCGGVVHRVILVCGFRPACNWVQHLGTSLAL